MNILTNNTTSMRYLYTYSFHEDEASLCRMEMRALFGSDTDSNILESEEKIDPSRSPFIKERIVVMFEAESIEGIKEQVNTIKLESTFKVIFVKNGGQEKVDFKDRRSIEREIGSMINGKVELIHPYQLFGIMKIEGRWIFGNYTKSESIWHRHQNKPQNYSTALSTRVARSIVNIAVPNPIGLKVIDPCCGVGTVLIEALSMDIDIIGSDLNPLVLGGTRENIAHFGFDCEVILKDIRHINGNYDVAIIDMPYNLCSVLPAEEQLEMLQSAKKFTKKLVVVTIETIDAVIEKAGFTIRDRCVAKKGSFKRQILVCE